MKKALIVVDYQNDFVDGALGFEKAPLLEPVIVEKVTRAREEGSEVLFTFDTHTENYLQTQEGKNVTEHKNIGRREVIRAVKLCEREPAQRVWEEICKRVK